MKIATMQEAHNASDMLRGCINRMFITDNSEEFEKMYVSAQYDLRLIYEANFSRLHGGRLEASQPGL